MLISTKDCGAKKMNKNEFSKKYRHFLRKKLNLNNIKRLENKDFSIISQNCIGGVILHELNQRFNSPTVNLFFSAEDFLKFASNLEYYLGMELVQIKTERPYPVGKLDDVTVYFMHYNSFQEASKKWMERIKRINWDNLYVMMSQTEGCTDLMVKEFDMLPFENKVIFTAKEYPDVKSAVYIKGSEISDCMVKDLCQYKSKFTGERLIDDFDYVSFLNL